MADWRKDLFGTAYKSEKTKANAQKNKDKKKKRDDETYDRAMTQAVKNWASKQGVGYNEDLKRAAEQYYKHEKSRASFRAESQEISNKREEARKKWTYDPKNNEKFDEYNRARKRMGLGPVKSLSGTEYKSMFGNEDTGDKGVYSRYKKYFAKEIEAKEKQKKWDKLDEVTGTAAKYAGAFGKTWWDYQKIKADKGDYISKGIVKTGKGIANVMDKYDRYVSQGMARQASKDIDEQKEALKGAKDFNEGMLALHNLQEKKKWKGKDRLKDIKESYEEAWKDKTPRVETKELREKLNWKTKSKTTDYLLESILGGAIDPGSYIAPEVLIKPAYRGLKKALGKGKKVEEVAKTKNIADFAEELKRGKAVNQQILGQGKVSRKRYEGKEAPGTEAAQQRPTHFNIKNEDQARLFRADPASKGYLETKEADGSITFWRALDPGEKPLKGADPYELTATNKVDEKVGPKSKKISRKEYENLKAKVEGRKADELRQQEATRAEEIRQQEAFDLIRQGYEEDAVRKYGVDNPNLTGRFPLGRPEELEAFDRYNEFIAQATPPTGERAVKGQKEFQQEQVIPNLIETFDKRRPEQRDTKALDDYADEIERMRADKNETFGMPEVPKTSIAEKEKFKEVQQTMAEFEAGRRTETEENIQKQLKDIDELETVLKANFEADPGIQAIRQAEEQRLNNVLSNEADVQGHKLMAQEYLRLKSFIIGRPHGKDPFTGKPRRGESENSRINLDYGWDDYIDRIPRHLVAARGSGRGKGLDTVAQEAGFDDIEEFVDYLASTYKSYRLARGSNVQGPPMPLPDEVIDELFYETQEGRMLQDSRDQIESMREKKQRYQDLPVTESIKAKPGYENEQPIGNWDEDTRKRRRGVIKKPENRKGVIRKPEPKYLTEEEVLAKYPKDELGLHKLSKDMPKNEWEVVNAENRRLWAEANPEIDKGYNKPKEEPKKPKVEGKVSESLQGRKFNPLQGEAPKRPQAKEPETVSNAIGEDKYKPGEEVTFLDHNGRKRVNAKVVGRDTRYKDSYFIQPGKDSTIKNEVSIPGSWLKTEKEAKAKMEEKLKDSPFAKDPTGPVKEISKELTEHVNKIYEAVKGNRSQAAESVKVALTKLEYGQEITRKERDYINSYYPKDENGNTKFLQDDNTWVDNSPTLSNESFKKGTEVRNVKTGEVAKVAINSTPRYAVVVIENKDGIFSWRTVDTALNKGAEAPKKAPTIGKVALDRVKGRKLNPRNKEILERAEVIKGKPPWTYERESKPPEDKDLEVGKTIIVAVSRPGKRGEFFTRGPITSIDRKNKTVTVNAGTVGTFEAPYSKINEIIEPKKPKKEAKTEAPKGEHSLEKRKYMSLSPNPEDIAAIKEAKPPHILLAYDKWGMTRGKNKRTYKNWKDFNKLIEDIGYEPESIVIDSGAYGLKDRTDIYDEVYETFMENYSDLDNEEIGSVIKMELKNKVLAGEELDPFLAYVQFVQHQKIALHNKKTRIFTVAFDQFVEPKEYDLDFLGDKSYVSQETYRALNAIFEEDVIPVYHYKEDPNVLKEYVGDTDYVALGGSVGIPHDERVAWIKGLIKQYPKVRFHLLGTMSKKLMDEVPELYSLDGSGWSSKKRGVKGQDKIDASAKKIKKIMEHEPKKKVEVANEKVFNKLLMKLPIEHHARFTEQAQTLSANKRAIDNYYEDIEEALELKFDLEEEFKAADNVAVNLGLKKKEEPTAKVEAKAEEKDVSTILEEGIKKGLTYETIKNQYPERQKELTYDEVKALPKEEQDVYYQNQADKTKELIAKEKAVYDKFGYPKGHDKNPIIQETKVRTLKDGRTNGHGIDSYEVGDKVYIATHGGYEGEVVKVNKKDGYIHVHPEGERGPFQYNANQVESPAGTGNFYKYNDIEKTIFKNVEEPEVKSVIGDKELAELKALEPSWENLKVISEAMDKAANTNKFTINSPYNQLVDVRRKMKEQIPSKHKVGDIVYFTGGKRKIKAKITEADPKDKHRYTVQPIDKIYKSDQILDSESLIPEKEMKNLLTDQTKIKKEKPKKETKQKGEVKVGKPKKDPNKKTTDAMLALMPEKNKAKFVELTERFNKVEDLTNKYKTVKQFHAVTKKYLTVTKDPLESMFATWEKTIQDLEKWHETREAIRKADIKPGVQPFKKEEPKVEAKIEGTNDRKPSKYGGFSNEFEATDFKVDEKVWFDDEPGLDRARFPLQQATIIGIDDKKGIKIHIPHEELRKFEQFRDEKKKGITTTVKEIGKSLYKKDDVPDAPVVERTKVKAKVGKDGKPASFENVRYRDDYYHEPTAKMVDEYLRDLSETRFADAIKYSNYHEVHFYDEERLSKISSLGSHYNATDNHVVIRALTENHDRTKGTIIHELAHVLERTLSKEEYNAIKRDAHPAYRKAQTEAGRKEFDEKWDYAIGYWLNEDQFKKELFSEAVRLIASNNITKKDMDILGEYIDTVKKITGLENKPMILKHETPVSTQRDITQKLIEQAPFDRKYVQVKRKPGMRALKKEKFERKHIPWKNPRGKGPRIKYAEILIPEKRGKAPTPENLRKFGIDDLLEDARIRGELAKEASYGNRMIPGATELEQMQSQWSAFAKKNEDLSFEELIEKAHKDLPNFKETMYKLDATNPKTKWEFFDKAGTQYDEAISPKMKWEVDRDKKILDLMKSLGFGKKAEEPSEAKIKRKVHKVVKEAKITDTQTYPPGDPKEFLKLPSEEKARRIQAYADLQGMTFEESALEFYGPTPPGKTKTKTKAKTEEKPKEEAKEKPIISEEDDNFLNDLLSGKIDVNEPVKKAEAKTEAEPLDPYAKGIANAFKGMGEGLKEAGMKQTLKEVDEKGYVQFTKPASIEMARKDPRYEGWTEEKQKDGSSRFYPPKEGKKKEKTELTPISPAPPSTRKEPPLAPAGPIDPKEAPLFDTKTGKLKKVKTKSGEKAKKKKKNIKKSRSIHLQKVYKYAQDYGALFRSGKIKDLSSHSAMTNTFYEQIRNLPKDIRRNIRGLMDKGKKGYVDLITNETDELNEKIIKKLGIKKGSKNSALVQDYGEKELARMELRKQGKTDEEIRKMDKEDIKKLNDKILNRDYPEIAKNIREANTFFHEKYKKLLLAYNQVQAQLYPGNKKKLIKEREDYFHHFEDLEGLEGIVNLFTKDINIDPMLEGKTAWTKPRSSFRDFVLRRTGGMVYKRDAVGGFLKYLQGSAHSIHINPVISELRAIADGIAVSTKDTPGLMGNTIRSLHLQANDLAGKTNPWDSPITTLGGKGRRLLRILSRGNALVGANMLVYNVGSLLGQLGGLPANVAAANPLNSAKGAKRTFQELFLYLNGKGNNLPIAQSKFLEERYLGQKLEKFDTEWWKKTSNFGGNLLTLVDKSVAHFTWNAMYQKALANKVADPIEYADRLTRDTIAGRSIGEVPLMHKAQLTKLVANFSIEVDNQWKVFNRIRTDKNKWERLNLFTYCIGAYALNAIVEELRGSPIAYDPYDAIHEGYNEEEDAKEAKKVAMAVGSLVGETIGATSYGKFGVALAGGLTAPFTNFELKEALGRRDPSRFGSELMALKPFENPLYLSPTGGAKQLEKSWQTWRANQHGGVYTKKAVLPWNVKGDLRFPVDPGDEGIRNYLFGPNRSPMAQEYYKKNRTPLRKSQTPAYKGKETMEEKLEYYNRIMENRKKEK